jgi:hypothetical protein
MPPNTDRPINRARVVGCAISATRNYLKFHMPRTLNPLLCNIHAETRKLWQRSAMRVANSLPGAVHQSTHRPLTHPACPPRCPLHSPGLPCMQTCTSSGVVLAPTIESSADMQSPWRSLLATAQLPATSCLGAFWSPAASARGQSCHRGDQKPAQEETYPRHQQISLSNGFLCFTSGIHASRAVTT